MGFKYKDGIDIIAMLKSKGYTSYTIRRDNIFGQRVWQKYRDKKELPSWNELNQLCKLLGCKPCDIIEYYDE